jgi:hypothetical protein
MADEPKPAWQRFAPFISDGISLVAILFALAVSWGKFDERLSNLEKKDIEAGQRTHEIKQDIQRELDRIGRSQERLEDKMDRVLRDRTK